MWRLSRTQLPIVRARLLVKYLFANSGASPKLHKTFCEFAAQIIFKRANDFGPSGSMGIFRGSKLIAVVVFHSWQPEYGVIEISAAALSPAWLTRRTINEIMTNCFERLDCQQIVSRMAVENKRAIQIYKFLGFQPLLLKNMRGRGKDEWLFLLTSDQWNNSKIKRG